MIIVPKATIKDHPKDWVSDWYPQPEFDVEDYQSRLNRITGLSRGQPIVRLEWGGTAYEMVHTQWDAWGNPTKTEPRPRHKLLRPSSIYGMPAKEIPIRRWILTEICEPERYRSEDNSDVMFEDTDGVKKQKIVKPKRGYYTPILVIGKHDVCPPDCSDRRLCYGDYKAPSYDELLWVKEAWANILKEKARDMHRAMTNAEAGEIAAKANKESAEDEEKAFIERTDDFSLDWLRTHGHRLKDEFLNGKYIFLGENNGNTTDSKSKSARSDAEKGKHSASQRKH